MKSIFIFPRFSALFKPIVLLSTIIFLGISAKEVVPEENGQEEYAVVKAILNSENTSIRKPSKIKKIILDAGHGGKDHGCSGAHSKEKVLALQMTKAIGKKIQYYHPEVEVIYTRETDVFIPLYKRIDIANKNKADLFISIHCNNINHKNTRGTETYVMGLHKAEENLTVAKRENMSILYEKDYINTYEGYDPNSPEGHIILSLYQNAYLEQSINFANKVERSFARRTPMKSRGVKQAGFVVLKRATMPSVLVETGFLSNKLDESYLRSSKGKNEIANAVALAFTEYKREMDEELSDIADAYVSLEMNRESIENDAEVSSPAKTPTQVATISQEPNENLSTDTPIQYKIQIAASNKKPLSQSGPMWLVITDLDIRLENDMYKYLTGNYTSLENAIAAKTKLRELGFKGAFIVAYKGEERVKL